MTINDTWGFKKDDTNFKSTETLLHNLVDIASKGGNYLLNVGPTAQGVIPAPEVERLQAVGKWMKVNGEAVYGTSPSPFKRLPWGRCTQKKDGANTILYLHVFSWPVGGKLVVPGLRNAVRSAYLLDGRRAVPFAQPVELVPLSGSNDVTLTLPATAPDPISSTVVLKIVGKPDVAPTYVGQDAAGVLKLSAADAVTHGGIQYEAGDNHDNLGYWTDPADWAEWPVTITRPGTFTVTAEIAAQGSGSFTVAADGRRIKEQSVMGTAPTTGDYAKFQTVTLGTLIIAAPGPTVISVHPVAAGWQPMNLRSLTLTPVR